MSSLWRWFRSFTFPCLSYRHWSGLGSWLARNECKPSNHIPPHPFGRRRDYRIKGWTKCNENLFENSVWFGRIKQGCVLLSQQIVVSSVSEVFSLRISVLFCSDIYTGTTFAFGRGRMFLVTNLYLFRGNGVDIPEWGVLFCVSRVGVFSDTASSAVAIDPVAFV